MFCPKCGKINPDNAEVCSGCNAPLHEEAPVPVKKDKKILKAVIVAAVVVAVVVVVVLLCTSCAGSPSPQDSMTF